jgi:SAM-dependent methyltransferase
VSSRFIVDVVAGEYERILKNHACGRLLDVGCGNVPLYGIYRYLVADATCVDWPNSIHQLKHLDIVANSNQALPFRTASFDTVLLTDVLEHVAEPATTIREVGRILCPGGKLLMGVPFLYGIHERPHDYYRYTEYALRRFCDLSGLAVIELRPYGGLPAVLVDLTSKGIESLPKLPRVGFRLIHSGLTFMYNSYLIRKLSERTESGFPLGYLLVAEKPRTGVVG